MIASSTLPKWMSDRCTSVRTGSPSRNSCRACLGHDDSQRAGSNAVVERRFKHGDFAVQSDSGTTMPRLYPNFTERRRNEILRSSEAPEQGAETEKEQAQPIGPMRDIQTQLAGIQASPPPYVEALHLIPVVADEDERRPSLEFFPACAQPDVDKWIAPQNCQGRPGEGRPLSVSQSLRLLAMADDARIKAQTRVVEEDAFVD